MSQLPPGPEGLYEDDAADGPQVNPLLIVHRVLRGRYLLAGILGLVLGVPLAIVGYILIPPQYTSRAFIEVNVSVPDVLYGDEVGDLIPAVEAYVSQQASRLQTERVLSRAVDNGALRSTGWPSGTAGLTRLRSSLTVTTPKRANQIILMVSDTSPLAAQTAAKAVLESYETIRQEWDQQQFGEKITRLRELKIEYESERNTSARLAIDRSISAAGTEDLLLAQRTQLSTLANIEDQIRELTTLLSLAGGPVDESDDEDGASEDDADDASDAEDDSDLTQAVDWAAIEDTKLDRLVDERDLLQRQLDSLLLIATPQHRQAKQYTRQIRVLELEIEARREEIASSIAASSEPLPTGTNRSELQARLEDLSRARQDSRDRLERIARARLEVVALQQQAEQAAGRLEDAERRLEALEVERESQVKEQVRVVQEPELPLQPSTDRRIPLAGAGFVGGFGLGVVSVAGFGFAFPRVRVADDIVATRGDFSMIGMIPEFPEHEGNGQGMNVREAFQFLRVLLDARSGRGTLICGVTSPTAGDGKTTISIRLAQSFAAARRRVLLIDADLVGRGATRSLGVSPREIDGLEFGTLDESIVRLEDAGIDFIPASRADDASEIFCGRVLGKMLDEMRSRYDVVLVDTGPILGSIEAAAMTPTMDQVLLVVSRGLESRLLKMATDRLRELNARSVGLIFNRATTIDFNRSFAPPSSTSRRSVGHGMTSAQLGDVRGAMDEGAQRDG